MLFIKSQIFLPKFFWVYPLTLFYCLIFVLQKNPAYLAGFLFLSNRVRRHISKEHWSNESERQPSSFISLCLSERTYQPSPTIISLGTLFQFYLLFFFVLTLLFTHVVIQKKILTSVYFSLLLLASLECWNKKQKSEQEKKRRKSLF